MLGCSACRCRILRPIFPNTVTVPAKLTHRTPASRRQTLKFRAWTPRTYATATATAHVDGGLQDQQVHPAERNSQKRQLGLKGSEFKRTELEQELRYLRDPLKLAENTLSLLRQDAHQKALELVRVASRTMACTVSWNHIIDHDMAHGKVSAAIKTYNEMKKRAQPPDAHTYTMLLRGLAAHAHYPQALSKALSIYNSMYAENSPVRPTIIHANAVLNVCALAKDLDCLFGIAARLPTKGKAAPNYRTYTTILNAIRTKAWRQGEEYVENESHEQRAALRQQAVLQGRRIWGDIIGRWGDGDMWIDEELVCSMGRVLLLGSRPEDFDDILSLVEQTMDIPRQVPRLGDPSRKTHLSPIQPGIAVPPSSEPTPVSGSLNDGQISLKEGSQGASSYALAVPSDMSNDTTPRPGSEFDPLPTSNSTIRSFARPGRNTLSLLMDACMRMRLTAAANAYRVILTSPDGRFKVTPDSENLHMYLRLLRQNRSSRAAVALVEDFLSDPPPGAGAQAKTFRIAMSCCVRNSQNPSVGESSIKLLRLMARTLEQPDLKTCEMYLELLGKKGEDEWRDMLRGLEELEVIVKNVRSLLAYGTFDDVNSALQDQNDEPDDEAEGETATDEERKKPSRNLGPHPQGTAASPGRVYRAYRAEVRKLFEKMIGVYDKVFYRGGPRMKPEERRNWDVRRRTLAAWVRREYVKSTKLRNMAAERREG
ncbi:MAG: hypothetical protein Q9187_005372 [Circinaria calcarea]